MGASVRASSCRQHEEAFTCHSAGQAERAAPPIPHSLRCVPQIGQQFSTRVDVLSPEFVQELEKLQVRVLKSFSILLEHLHQRLHLR